MNSKYCLNDLPTSGKIAYRGVNYPIWDVDGLPVSTNTLWKAAGFDTGTMNEDAKPVDDAIVIWTDENAPIDGICKIASEQGGSGTPEKIVKDLEKRIEAFNGLIYGLKAWNTGIDGNDGATEGIWRFIPESMIPHATRHEWHYDLICEKVDHYIGSRCDLTPSIDMRKIFDGYETEVMRLHAWALDRAQAIYDGCREIDKEYEEKHRKAEEVCKRNEAVETFAREIRDRMVYALYETPKGVRGYGFCFSTAASVYDFLEYDNEKVKLLKVYIEYSDELEDYYTEKPKDEVVAAALRLYEILKREEAA